MPLVAWFLKIHAHFYLIPLVRRGEGVSFSLLKGRRIKAFVGSV